MEIQVDAKSFTADELLILRVWTNPGRTQLLAEAQQRGYAQFRVFEEVGKYGAYLQVTEVRDVVGSVASEPPP